jgi:hypothetical protein
MLCGFLSRFAYILVLIIVIQTQTCPNHMPQNNEQRENQKRNPGYRLEWEPLMMVALLTDWSNQSSGP